MFSYEATLWDHEIYLRLLILMLVFEDLRQIAPHDFRALRSINALPYPLLLVIFDNGPCLLVESIEPLAEGVDIVVRALDERLACYIVSHGFLWWPMD